jgi:hypothetical protein
MIALNNLIDLLQDLLIPRQFNRQIDTIPEYESDTVPTAQSKANNQYSPSPNASPTMNTNKTLAKRSPNQTIPIAKKTDAFVHIPQQVNIERNLLTGRNHSLYNDLLLLLLTFR